MSSLRLSSFACHLGGRRPIHLRGWLPHHFPSLGHWGGGSHCAALLGEVHAPHRLPDGICRVCTVHRCSGCCWDSLTALIYPFVAAVVLLVLPCWCWFWALCFVISGPGCGGSGGADAGGGAAAAAAALGCSAGADTASGGAAAAATADGAGADSGAVGGGVPDCHLRPGNLGMHQFDVVKPLADVALQLSSLRSYTGRDKPTVIT